MYFVHSHTSLPIMPNQPCDVGESLLCAGSDPAEQSPSFQQSPRLTDHPGVAEWSRRSMYIDDLVCTMYMHL